MGGKLLGGWLKRNLSCPFFTLSPPIYYVLQPQVESYIKVNRIFYKKIGTRNCCYSQYHYSNCALDIWFNYCLWQKASSIESFKAVLNIIIPNTQHYPISIGLINDTCKVNSVYKGWYSYNKRWLKVNEAFAKLRSANALRKGMT